MNICKNCGGLAQVSADGLCDSCERVKEQLQTSNQPAPPTRYRVCIIMYQMAADDPDAVDDVLRESVLLDTESQDMADAAFDGIGNVIWDNADGILPPE